GFQADLIPLAPPDAALKPWCKVAPKMRGKVPCIYHKESGEWSGFKEFTQHTATDADIAQWNTWPGAGVGLLARHYPGVDIDCRDPVLAEKIHELAIEMLGPAPCRTGNAPKRLLMYKGPPMQKKRLMFESGDAVEVLGDGQQYVVE